MMTEVIPAGLGRDQPLAVLSGPTFAVELMQGLPTAIVAASTDKNLAGRVKQGYTFFQKGKFADAPFWRSVCGA